MITALADLDQRFDSIKDQEDLEALLRETEELMLRETQDWLMLMKFVKVEAV
jgi:CBS-domain-containing membrane protein